MSSKNEKATVGCRVLSSTILDIDKAAKAEGLNRGQWIEQVIQRALGEQPARSLTSRVAQIELRLSELESAGESYDFRECVMSDRTA